MRQTLKANDWHYRRFGTARVVHLRLLLNGASLTNCSAPMLHHIGGLSHCEEQHVAPLGKRLRRFADRMTHGAHSPWINLLGYLPHTISQLTALEREQLNVRRVVTNGIMVLLEALISGAPVPPPPKNR